MTRYLLPILVLGCSNDKPDTALLDQQNQLNETSSSEQAWANEYLQSMNELVSQENVYSDLNPIEHNVLELERSFFLPFEQLLQQGTPPSADKITAFFQQTVHQKTLNWSILPEDIANLQDIKEDIYKSDCPIELSNTTSGNLGFGDFLQAFSRIDSFQWDVFDAEQKTNEGQDILVLSVRLDLRAELIKPNTFHRLNDRVVVNMSFTDLDSSNKSDWQLVEIETISSERILSTREPTFVNATNKWKLDTLPVSDRKEAIRRGGYALAVVDLDGDSLKDIIVGQHGPVQILRNTGTSFIDVTSLSS